MAGQRHMAMWQCIKWWPCREPSPPREPCLARLCYRFFFLKQWYGSIAKHILHNFFAKNISASRQKCAWSYFYPVANKGLIKTIMTTSRINLMSQTILLHTKLCKVYRVYCLNYIVNESYVSMKNTNFVTSLLQCNQFFLERVQIVIYFKPTANYRNS